VASELEARRSLNYPPFGRMVLLRFSSADGQLVEAETERIAKNLADYSDSYQVLGPSPAMVLRVANRYRWQIMLKYSPGASLQVPPIPAVADGVSMSIDVEPLNFL
jgi:primosomal protein N' (replication factor Y) (superfamily II helicase)